MKWTKIWLDMTIKGNLEPFWSMFDPASQRFSDFWWFFWLNWTRIWLDMTIKGHLKLFWAIFNQASLSTIFDNFQLFGENGPKWTWNYNNIQYPSQIGQFHWNIMIMASERNSTSTWVLIRHLVCFSICLCHTCRSSSHWYQRKC